MTKEFEILNNFIGIGNPYGTYWFIGLEEAGEWGEDQEDNRVKLEKYKNRIIALKPGEIEREAKDYEDKNPGKRFTRVYDLMSQLVLAASIGTESDSREYRNNELLQESGETFQLNLYPLGKKSLKTWPARYVDRFGYRSMKDYYREVTGERFRILHQEWTKYDPAITVCFGKTEWDSFRKLLKLESKTGHQDCGWYQVYLSRIILCPFFMNNHMSAERILCLGQEIRKLLDKANRKLR